MSILSQQKQSVNTDFPNIRPSLDLRFALAKKLDPRVTFSRGSTGTYFGPDGLMKVAGVNEPRFDHDPVTGQSLGLLIEESRTNLWLYSDNPQSAYFDPSFTAFNSNSIISPDGTQNADKVLALSGKSFAQISQGVTITSGATVTGSVYVKYGGFNRVELVMLSNNNTTPYARATFDPTTGTITTAVSTANGGTNASANIVFVGNGWYRCNVTVTYPAVTLAGMRINATSSTGGISEGTVGVYVWGSQIETGAFPTSYIPTSGSTVTRSADLASMTGTNFSSWYNSSEGTFFTQAKSIATISGSTRRFLEVSNGLAQQRYLLGYSTTSNTRFLVTTSLVNQADITTTAKPSAGVKMCASYATNNFSSATNGTLATRDISGLVPTVDRMIIGWDGITANAILCGTISRLTYYPIQITNQQLINLTS